MFKCQSVLLSQVIGFCGTATYLKPEFSPCTKIYISETKRIYFNEENKANNWMQAVPQSNNADHIEDSADQNVYVHLWYLVGSSPS